MVVAIKRGKTSPRKSRSRQQMCVIQQEARRLFWEKGFDGTTMKDIAVACEFEPGNLYNYYKNKEHLLFQVIKEESRRANEILKPIAEDITLTPPARLCLFIKKHFEFLVGPRAVSGLLFDSALKHLTPKHHKHIIKLRDAYQDIMIKILKDGAESGDFALRDARLACYFISSLILRSRVWFSPKGRLSADEVSDSLSEFVLNALKRSNT